ncbi:MAG: hypothetical protein COA96_14785 [SAR86 cluster bacterium]|uniref:CAAX prenyl protease 2/Lysostaphin resistance protein A-like domain-containing protein n=1 Tax=SAR86 cluster bacterium TaxID=2030880 RepID=A0A2A5ASM3_9GAMM|nr:MAG: hypothetical protein COA96_14785 [SAR86 cluster bacterium]
MHFISRSYVVYIFGVSISLGLLMLYTQNVLVPMVAHTMFNFLALEYGIQFRKQKH